MSDILKGNFEAPKVKTEQSSGESTKTSETLEEQFEAAALKKLGGSITFVKKEKAGFVWRGKK